MRKLILLVLVMLILSPVAASAQGTQPPSPPLSKENDVGTGALGLVPYYVRFIPDADGDFLEDALQAIDAVGGKVRYVFENITLERTRIFY